MEKIIIYAFVIAIGILFDYVKKRMRGTQSSAPVNSTPQNKPAKPSAWQTMLASLQAQPAPKQADRRPAAPKPAPQFLSGETVDEITAPINETPISEPMTDNPTPKDNAEHYARWRQAIIDAEILQRKF